MDVAIKCSENPTDYVVVYFGTSCSQIVMSSCSKIYILCIVNTIDYIYFCLITHLFTNSLLLYLQQNSFVNKCVYPPQAACLTK